MQHPKGVLIERAKQLGLGKPSFATHNTGPEHEPLFTSTVTIRNVVYGEGEGGTKRDAERRASEEALETLKSTSQGVSHESASSDSASPDSASRPQIGTETTLEPFDGPWPIFPEILAASLNVAHARLNPTLTGPDAVNEVQALAVQLYKGTLEQLGEVVELDEELPEDSQN